MSTPSARAEQQGELIVSELGAEGVRRLLETVARAAGAGELGSLAVTSPEEAERIVDRVLRAFCRSYPAACGEGLYQHVSALVDRSLVHAALERSGGCQVRAAELLGISRNTLRRKMRALGIRSETVM